MTPALEERITNLPDKPGIYVFKDADGGCLYVGKAASLRKRVASYLREPADPRLRRMISEAVDLEIVLADNEAEALALENHWIKEKRPRHNILLRDDKTYPYVKLTNEAWPRLAFTRRIRDDGADYFGPYLPAGLARKAIKLVQKMFGVRVCRIEIDGSLPRPCLYHGMDRCLGPCVEGLTTREAYEEAIEKTRLFLGGRNEDLLRRLRAEMEDASEALEYERAASLRDTIAEVEGISQRQKVASTRGEDVDIYGAHVSGGNAAVTILVMRGGRVLDRRELFWEGEAEVDVAELLEEILPQVYDRTSFIPKEIHLPAPTGGVEALEDWLGERKGERVYVRFPARGEKRRRVELAMRNARLAHRRRFRGQREGQLAAGVLADSLGLSDAPQRIEAFDVSHLQGGETVGSLVVWEAGTMRKSDYRTFNVRGLVDPDDYAALRQVVHRRYRRVLEETGAMPDLVVVDGGRGQLNTALEALTELGVEETPIAAIAKREEEVYLPARPEPLRIDADDAGLRLLQQIRDEAHRFAVSRHRQRRRKRTLVSKLDDLHGIGVRRKRQLLQRFGSLDGVREASAAELRDALGPVVGMRVYRQLGSRPESASEEDEPAVRIADS